MGKPRGEHGKAGTTLEHMSWKHMGRTSEAIGKTRKKTLEAMGRSIKTINGKNMGWDIGSQAIHIGNGQNRDTYKRKKACDIGGVSRRG